MIGNSLLTQVGIAAVSIGIIMTYIQPAFGEIRDIQNNISQTQEELAKVTEVNNRLANLYNSVNSIPQRDKNALFVYLPDKTDEVLVMKDVTAIAKDAEISITNISYKGMIENHSKALNDNIGQPFTHSFSVDFFSSYEQLKDFLQRLEQNNYPLVIDKMSVKPNESGQLTTNLTIITYSHNE